MHPKHWVTHSQAPCIHSQWGTGCYLDQFGQGYDSCATGEALVAPFLFQEDKLTAVGAIATHFVGFTHWVLSAAFIPQANYCQ